MSGSQLYPAEFQELAEAVEAAESALQGSVEHDQAGALSGDLTRTSRKLFELLDEQSEYTWDDEEQNADPTYAVARELQERMKTARDQLADIQAEKYRRQATPPARRERVRRVPEVQATRDPRFFYSRIKEVCKTMEVILYERGKAHTVRADGEKRTVPQRTDAILDAIADLVGLLKALDPQTLDALSETQTRPRPTERSDAEVKNIVRTFATATRSEALKLEHSPSREAWMDFGYKVLSEARSAHIYYSGV